MDGGVAKRAGSRLEVRRCYDPSRMAQDVLASAYEQIVPSGGRPRPDWRRTNPEFVQEISQQQRSLCSGG